MEKCVSDGSWFRSYPMTDPCMYGIYYLLVVNVTIYIAAPWILWVCTEECDGIRQTSDCMGELDLHQGIGWRKSH